VTSTEQAAVLEVFRRLESAYDIDRWHWQESTPALDICLGAILVQHTSWSNVEKALVNLRAADAMSIDTLNQVELDELAALVRPVGTPLTKASRLKTFAALAIEAGDLEALLSRPLTELRPMLLATRGIGPETADVICLYAAKQPALVHDAYTERLFRRLGFGPAGNRYTDWQEWQASVLPAEVRFYQRFHAAIVVHCKETCRVQPRCERCPVQDLCAYAVAAI
jgi:endonuclease-3 related protein